MATAVVKDLRRLTLSADTVVDAALEFDRVHKGQLWRYSVELAELGKQDDSPSLALSLRLRPEEEPVDRRFGASELAAAVILYCNKAGIPLPRRGTKTISVTDEGELALTIEMTVHVRRLHRAPADTGRPANPADVT